MTFEQLQSKLDTLEAHLEQLDAIPQASLAEFQIVHLYDRVDPQRVFEILTIHRADIARLLDLVLAAVQAENAG